MKGSHLAAGGRLPPYPPPPPARAVTSTYGQPPRPAPPHPPDLRPSLRQPLGSSNNDSDLRDSSISAMNTSAEFDYVQARPVRIVSPTRDNNRLQGGGFHGNHKGSNGRLHGSSHNSPSSLDVIPERTFLANTMSEMKSVVVWTSVLSLSYSPGIFQFFTAIAHIQLTFSILYCIQPCFTFLLFHFHFIPLNYGDSRLGFIVAYIYFSLNFCTLQHIPC